MVQFLIKLTWEVWLGELVRLQAGPGQKYQTWGKVWLKLKLTCWQSGQGDPVSPRPLIPSQHSVDDFPPPPDLFPFGHYLFLWKMKNEFTLILTKETSPFSNHQDSSCNLLLWKFKITAGQNLLVTNNLKKKSFGMGSGPVNHFPDKRHEEIAKPRHLCPHESVKGAPVSPAWRASPFTTPGFFPFISTFTFVHDGTRHVRVVFHVRNIWMNDIWPLVAVSVSRGEIMITWAISSFKSKQNNLTQLK